MMLNTVKDRIRTKGSTSSLGLITCLFLFFLYRDDMTNSFYSAGFRISFPRF